MRNIWAKNTGRILEQVSTVITRRTTEVFKLEGLNPYIDLRMHLFFRWPRRTAAGERDGQLPVFIVTGWADPDSGSDCSTRATAGSIHLLDPSHGLRDSVSNSDLALELSATKLEVRRDVDGRISALRVHQQGDTEEIILSII
jgi:hypothetical protein